MAIITDSSAVITHKKGNMGLEGETQIGEDTHHLHTRET